MNQSGFHGSCHVRVLNLAQMIPNFQHRIEFCKTLVIQRLVEPKLFNLLGQWLNFKLFGITCLVGKIKFKLFFFRVHWLSELKNISPKGESTYSKPPPRETPCANFFSWNLAQEWGSQFCIGLIPWLVCTTTRVQHSMWHDGKMWRDGKMLVNMSETP